MSVCVCVAEGSLWAAEFDLEGRQDGDKRKEALLTELHRVQRGHVTAERLHREDGDLVPDISNPRQPVQPKSQQQAPRIAQPGGP